MRQIRHYQRHALTGNGLIHCSSGHKAAFSVNNISASGMSITAEAELEENEMIDLEVQLFGNILPYKKRLKGKVVRILRRNTAFEYGIRFLELTRKDMVETDEYLRLNTGSAGLHQHVSGDTAHDDDPVKRLSRSDHCEEYLVKEAEEG
jgi:hypothetical protein